MATYKISDILLKLAEMIEDDHTFVELNEYPEEDDSPAFLSFNVPVECERPDFDVSDYESIDACDPNDPVSNDPIAISQDSLCPNVLFSYDEISTLELSLKNSIEYLQNYIDSPNSKSFLYFSHTVWRIFLSFFKSCIVSFISKYFFFEIHMFLTFFPGVLFLCSISLFLC